MDAVLIIYVLMLITVPDPLLCDDDILGRYFLGNSAEHCSIDLTDKIPHRITVHQSISLFTYFFKQKSISAEYQHHGLGTDALAPALVAHAFGGGGLDGRLIHWDLQGVGDGFPHLKDERR